MRLERTFAEYSRVAKLRREGLSLPVIAQRMGWTERTAYNWERASREWDLACAAFARKGIKMTGKK